MITYLQTTFASHFCILYILGIVDKINGQLLSTISSHLVLLYLPTPYAAPGETPEQRLENALSSVNQRQARYGGMTTQQFQAVQEKRKQLWKKKVSCEHSVLCDRVYF